MDTLINELIIDKYFGIYNRNGFEYIVNKNENKDFKIYLLDFNSVKKMNIELGYLSVNNIFKNALSELKNDYTIGRAFSGDEIFFLTERLDDDINKIETICNKNGLYFEYIEFINDGEDELEVLLEKMIDDFK